MRPEEFTVYLGGRKYDSLKNSLSKQEASRRLCSITWYWTSLVSLRLRINPPAIAGDTGLIPGLGRFCILGSNKSYVPQLQSPALKPMLCSKRSHRSEKPVLESSSHLSKLEKNQQSNEDRVWPKTVILPDSIMRLQCTEGLRVPEDHIIE